MSSAKPKTSLINKSIMIRLDKSCGKRAWVTLSGAIGVFTLL
jgi:hypothetical protein